MAETLGYCKNCPLPVTDEDDRVIVCRPENGYYGPVFYYHLACYVIIESEFQAIQEDLLEALL